MQLSLPNQLSHQTVRSTDSAAALYCWALLCHFLQLFITMVEEEEVFLRSRHLAITLIYRHVPEHRK